MRSSHPDAFLLPLLLPIVLVGMFPLLVLGVVGMLGIGVIGLLVLFIAVGNERLFPSRRHQEFSPRLGTRRLSDGRTRSVAPGLPDEGRRRRDGHRRLRRIF